MVEQDNEDKQPDQDGPQPRPIYVISIQDIANIAKDPATPDPKIERSLSAPPKGRR